MPKNVGQYVFLCYVFLCLLEYHVVNLATSLCRSTGNAFEFQFNIWICIEFKEFELRWIEH